MSDFHEEKVLDEIRQDFGDGLLELLRENEVDPLLFYRADGTICFVNSAAEKTFRPLSPLVGTNFLDHRRSGFDVLGVKLKGVELHRGLIERALRGEATRGFFDLIDGDTIRHMEVIYGPARGVDGELVGIIAQYRDATELHRVAEDLTARTVRLRETQEFLESILDVMDDGLVVMDKKLRIRLANATAIRLLRVTGPLEELNDLRNTSLLDPARLIEDVRRISARRKSSKATFITDGPQGRRRVEIGLRYTGLKGREVLVVLRDVTESQELRQVRLLADVARLGSEKRRLDELGSRLLEIFFEAFDIDIAVLVRAERGRLVPMSWRGLLLDPNHIPDPGAYPSVVEALQTLKPTRSDAGEWGKGSFRGDHFIVPLVASGSVVGTLHLGGMTDSSESRSGDDEPLDWKDPTFLNALGGSIASALHNCWLFEENEAERMHLETLIEHIPEGVLVFDSTGRVLFRNEAAVEIMGFQLDDMNSDVRPYRLLNAEMEPIPRAEWPHFRAARTGKMVRDARIYAEFENEVKVVDATVVPIRLGDEHPTSYLGVFHDVTEKSQREARRDEFLSVASHELRSPLTPLTGFLQMVRRQLERGEPVELELIERSERQVLRLARLIDVLLDMTRIETGHMVLNIERTDLVELARRVVDAWDGHRRPVDVKLVAHQESIIGHVDPMRIDQVLTNLIDNAVKYSDEGDVVTVELGTRENRAIFSVSDNGEGIDKEEIALLFDRYYQVERGQHRGSMGLGLYITREIIQQHGGTIRIESTRGVGTRVEFEVPLRTH